MRLRLGSFSWISRVLFNGGILAFGVACTALSGASGNAQEYLNGIEWQPPAVVTPGVTNATAPSDAVILFDGKDFSHWKNASKWEIEGDAMVAGQGAITSTDEFGDCQVHIEWSAPTPPKGLGQGRGNSGVFLMGIYELQVLDSFDNATYHDGQASAIYKQTPPMVNAMRKPGEWNTYDILWTTPASTKTVRSSHLHT